MFAMLAVAAAPVTAQEVDAAWEEIAQAKDTLWTMGLPNWLNLWFKAYGLVRGQRWDALNRPLVVFPHEPTRYHDLVATHLEAVHEAIRAGHSVHYEALESHPGLRKLWNRAGWRFVSEWHEDGQGRRHHFLRAVSLREDSPLARPPKEFSPALDANLIHESVCNLPLAYRM